ncbi:unnamed protein product, partial [Hapterophycus canaliculatus]
IRWSTPLYNDEDLNGRRKLQPKSTLPARSGLVGGRAGRLPPDTRSSCAQTGISGTFSMPGDDKKGEDEEKEEVCEVRTAPAPLPSARASSPAPGSLPEHRSDGGPRWEKGASGKSRGAMEGGLAAASAATSVAPTAAQSAAGASSAGVLRRPPGGEADREGGGPSSPGADLRDGQHGDAEEVVATRARGSRRDSCDRSVSCMDATGAGATKPAASLRRKPSEPVEESGNEEQGRELLMSAMVGGSEELGQKLMAGAMTGGSSISEEEFGDVGGEEEQGRELMMMFSSGDPGTLSPPAEGREDHAVPPLPPAAESEDDDMSFSSSGSEDEDGREAAEEDAFVPPVNTVTWRTPKKTSKETLVLGVDESSTTSASTGTAALASRRDPGTTTVSHKPRLSIRDFTRFSSSGGAAAVPDGATTAPCSFPFKRSLQPPVDSSAHHRCSSDADAITGLPASSVPVQQVSWRAPRQTAPAPVTPSSSFERHQEPSAEQQHGDTPSAVLRLELPLEAAVPLDAEVTGSQRGASAETPSVLWRTPARADRLLSCTASQQAEDQHAEHQYAFPPSSPTSLLSFSCSSVDGASTRSDEEAEPMERGDKRLPPFGAYPFRPPDERDSVPQSQLKALLNSCAEKSAQRTADAELRRRCDEEEAGARARTNSALQNRTRPAEDDRARSPSSGLTTRESSSRSSSRSRSDTGCRRPHHAVRASSPRYSRDSRDRGYKRGKYPPSEGRRGPGDRRVDYHDDDRRDGRRDD